MQALNVESADQNERRPGSLRHSHHFRGPLLPPQSPRPLGSVRSPTNSRSPSPAQFPPHFVSPVTPHVNTVACSLARQAQEWAKPGYSDDYVAKTNCVEISGGGNVDGLTLNNGGTNNSGAGVSSV